METTHTYRLIDRNTLKAKLDRKETFHLWNVMGPDYYKPEENIPGSKNVPVNRLEEMLPALGVKKDDEIVAYCAGGQCQSSLQAAEKLASLGYTTVWAYEGGLKDWKEGGHPLATVPAAK